MHRRRIVIGEGERSVGLVEKARRCDTRLTERSGESKPATHGWISNDEKLRLVGSYKGCGTL